VPAGFGIHLWRNSELIKQSCYAGIKIYKILADITIVCVKLSFSFINLIVSSLWLLIDYNLSCDLMSIELQHEDSCVF